MPCSLVRQFSATPCTENATFGCLPDGMWASGGCRGRFSIGATKMRCEGASTRVECRPPRPRALPQASIDWQLSQFAIALSLRNACVTFANETNSLHRPQFVTRDTGELRGA